MRDLRNNLAKAKGLGSSKMGTHHWWHQRLTSILLTFLTIWLLVLIKYSYEPSLSLLLESLKKPHNLLLLNLFAVIGLYHGMLGMQVVIEDYISCMTLRFSLVIFLQIFCLITGSAFITASIYMITI